MKQSFFTKFINIFLTAIFFFSISVPITHAENVYFYHNDHLGSPLAMTDMDGNVVWRRDYQPFGEEIDPGGETASNTHTYTGKEFDSETGLFYYGARYYDPTIGRFISVDPVGGKPEVPQTWNRYIYTLNNPYKYVDPDGRVLQLVGTAKERSTQQGWLSNIAGTTVNTDFHGKVLGDFSSPSKFSEVEGWMKDIIKSEKVVNVQFGKCKTGVAGCFSVKDGEGVATIDPMLKDPNQEETWYGAVSGALTGGAPFYSGEGVISHEVLGHGLDFIRDKRDKKGKLINDQRTAIDQANKVRRLLGKTERR